MNQIDPRAIGAQIRMQMPFLTPLEARVVDTITGRSDLSETTALRDVAEDAGVSDAMVVKIAKKLGFNGFRDLRAALVNYQSLDVADLHQEISPDDSSADIIQKVFRTAVQAL
jgi:DNA-binding MurR/RpiR family transcriptional regulator